MATNSYQRPFWVRVSEVDTARPCFRTDRGRVRVRVAHKQLSETFLGLKDRVVLFRIGAAWTCEGNED